MIHINSGKLTEDRNENGAGGMYLGTGTEETSV
jgi:hypothetical protein